MDSVVLSAQRIPPQATRGAAGPTPVLAAAPWSLPTAPLRGSTARRGARRGCRKPRAGAWLGPRRPARSLAGVPASRRPRAPRPAPGCRELCGLRALRPELRNAPGPAVALRKPQHWATPGPALGAAASRSASLLGLPQGRRRGWLLTSRRRNPEEEEKKERKGKNFYYFFFSFSLQWLKLRAGAQELAPEARRGARNVGSTGVRTPLAG